MSQQSDQNKDISSRQSAFILPDVRNLDIKKISPQIPSSPDYIPSASARGRDIFQRLFFNTGALFLLGFSGGGMYGSIEGFRNAVNPSLRIRINSVINGMSRRGSRLGNSLGIIAFLHTSFIGVADLIDMDTKVGYPVTPAFAGLATGLLFGSSRGYRAAAFAGVVGAGGSVIVWFGGAYVYNVYFRRSTRF